MRQKRKTKPRKTDKSKPKSDNMRGEGSNLPPFSVNFFPLTFRENLVRDGLGGGYHLKEEIRSFPTMYKTGGDSWGQFG